ncbi:lethal (3) 72Dr isoform 2-T2 [Cochliomyia hominivorax]
MSINHHKNNNNNNFTSIIGILCIDIATELREKYGNDYYSYIAARVIPIWIKRPRSYYENIMNKINGILLPGGAVYFDTKYCTKELHNDCVQSSKYIYEIAKELSENGKPFPLWGTCMGFQLMLTHSADNVEIRQDCKPMDCSLPLILENDEILASSKLFANLDNELKFKMSNLPFGVHFHKYCITKDDLRSYKIDKQWKVLASNKDENDVEFITLVEHNSLPFYGSQIHPERVMFDNYESQIKRHHCLECFHLAKYFANFFVKECNLNSNYFDSKLEESKYFIQNFPLVLDAKEDNKKFRQYYLFKEDVDYL